MLFSQRVMNKAKPLQKLLFNQSLVRQTQRYFRQVHNLHEVNYTTNLELIQRTVNYLQKTDRVYLPSKTIEFDRNGELLLYS